MRALPLAILLPAAAWAQSIVDPRDIPFVMSRFEPRGDDRPLACSVTPFAPTLNFSFRIEAGYIVRVPMSQFFGPGHLWFILLRVTPEGGGGKPVFLASRTRLPDAPKTKVEVELGGGYLLGEGRYRVRWMMLDDMGRVCRKEWRIETKAVEGRAEVRGVDAALHGGRILAAGFARRSPPVRRQPSVPGHHPDPHPTTSRNARAA